MSHRPVCKTCEVEFQCAENGVNVVDYAERGPQKIWEADEFECPGCNFVIIIGFGDRRFSGVGDDDFDKALAWADDHDTRRNNYIDKRTKSIYKEAS